MSRAFERGAARARGLKRLERRGIIGGAVNPYSGKAARADWQRGFMSTYYGKES